MKTKRMFFTSDWHLFHDKVIKFSNRPFSDVNDMHEALIRRYNATVPEDAICYFLGDFSFGKSEATKEIVSRLNGTKVLIRGNHDPKQQTAYQWGFDVVLQSATLMIGGSIISISHCPLYGIYREDTTGNKGGVEGENWHGETMEKNRQYTIYQNNSDFHLHGHIHSPNSGKSERILGNQLDVGVDANKYTPVSSSQIESWIHSFNINKEEEG